MRFSIFAGLAFAIIWASTAQAAPETYQVGVAKVDVTPAFPIRLNGFAFRKTESEGVTQRIWAKALAIDDGEPAVLVAVDNLGVPAALVEDLARRLEKKAGLKRDRLAVTATHTHTGPMINGVSPTIFGVPIPKEHLERIDRYTREFADKLEQAALAALADRKPARLSWGIGKVTFAANRRTSGGPVDHDLPVLVVKAPQGKVRAVYVSYACHCVTLSHNKISGDWAGYAQELIQDEFPGAIALVSVGCGADSNPSSGVTGDKVEIASRQGAEIAAEVKRLAGGFLAPVAGKLTTKLQRFDLPLVPLPTREDWQVKAKRKDAIGHHARVNLERLDRGEKLPAKIDYSVQTWAFGDALAMVFLPGEVVVDYSHRLKRELDGLRLWVNAYANGAPCYIPSERILREGGYEGGGAMVYYDVTAPLAPGLEKKIIDAVHEQLDARFKAPTDPKKTGDSRPLSPQQSLAAIQTKKDLAVELVLAEPLVIDPVAIDWGADGRLWVCEMHDYPSGLRGDFQPGGRVRVVRDTDGDGKYDTATVFLDNIPFPTGVTTWRKGVLVCAAPDILYAEDTDGDGKADVVKKLFSGFGTGNYQARVNSLEYGLDGWVYGSCGLFGGTIKTFTGKEVQLGDRDFRIKPDEGILEPATGRTQQGRVRDDWGNWFGCDNSTLCRHYPLADHYLRRNPHVVPPPNAVYVPDYPNSNRLFPIRQVQTFKLTGPQGQATSVCGLGIYRDDLLGGQYKGNAFVCEPVNLLVHRLILTPKGSTFSGRRAPDEQQSEFLASTDNWFRPVQVRTGPDGCLWVVDMYRYVIEHPRWIPPEDVAKLDLRAGDRLGRIYRVRPKEREPRPMPRLDKLRPDALVDALNSPNGWQRDLVGQMLLWQPIEKPGVLAKVQGTAGKLKWMVTTEPQAETRLHALCLLARINQVDAATISWAVAFDKHAGARRHAVRLLEKFLTDSPKPGAILDGLVNDPDAQVRLQLACTLGEWRHPQAGRLLADLALKHGNDPYLTAAVLSSVNAGNITDVLTETFTNRAPEVLPEPLIQQFLSMALALGDKKALPAIIRDITAPHRGRVARWQLAALAGMLDTAERRGQSLDRLVDEPTRQQFARMLDQARAIATNEKAPEGERLAAVRVLGRDARRRDADLKLLGELLVPQNPAALQNGALVVLGRIPDEQTATVVLGGWGGYTPALKSQVLDLLLSRDAWQRQLLQAVEQKQIPVAQIDATRRQRLLAHKDEQVRSRAAKLFAGATRPDRQKVLDDYRQVATLTGNAAPGKAVFAKVCANCHRLQNEGHHVGPDLAALSNKSPQYLLQEIFDPNKNIDSRYVEYVASTKAGRVFTGLLASETGTSITLRGQEGKEQLLLRTELEDLASTGKSLMPEGLEKDLSPQTMADLIAYLVSNSAPPKRFAGNNPAVVQPVNGSLALLATNGEIYGGDIVFEEPFRNVGYWHGADDHVAWTVQLEKSGWFDVWLDYSCDSGVAGNAFVLEGTQPALRGKVKGTGGWDRYRQEKVGTVALNAGRQRIVFRPDGGKPNGALLDLRGIHLVPLGQKLALAGAAPPAPKNVKEVARQILDDQTPGARRQALVTDNLDRAGELVAAMTADLKPGTKEEYRRIPWIWRVAIGAGRKNDADPIRKLLDVSLPKAGEPLLDWQAVVVGGGVINGISLQGQWPGERLNAILKEQGGLKERLQQSLVQAAAMADNEKVPTGTRYDALRMIALDTWQRRGKQLAKYLEKGVNAELQMGAVSGLSDMDVRQVAPLLLANLGHFSASNRKLAVEALLRTEARTAALLDALEQGKVKPGQLSKEHAEALRKLKNDTLRKRAEKLLPNP